MAAFLQKFHEERDIKKIKNLTVRLNYLATHLVSIIAKVESEFSRIQRSIIIGKETVSQFQSLKSNLQSLLQLLMSFASFTEHREDVLKNVSEELKRLENQYRYSIYISKHGSEEEMKVMKVIMSQEDADKKMIGYLHSKMADIKSGIFMEIYQRVKGKESLFPAECQDSRIEFLHYMKKLIGAFHQLSKLALGVERLEDEEEANLSYLYSLLGETKHVEQHSTEIQKLIARLEKEFI